MCLSPKWVYKRGNYKSDNYRGMAGEFYELGTYSKCGSCEICMNEKMNNWVIRNYYEQKAHKNISWITLTYEESPYIIVQKDFQDWLKRFRIYLDRTSGEKIRYFSAYEYGTLRGRPHGHFIIYGWTDKNAKYLSINKKGQIMYQSKIIQETWGLGRTSIQQFNEHQIPYAALYETSQEQFKRAYKLNHEKVSKLENMARNNLRMKKEQRDNLYATLQKARKELEESKKKYTMVREKNSWSIALGWEEFFKEYARERTHTFKAYIEDKEFVIPTPWVKKLANMGDIEAANEMFRREKLIQQSANETIEKTKNILKVQAMRKKEVIDWKSQKTELEDF